MTHKGLPAVHVSSSNTTQGRFVQRLQSMLDRISPAGSESVPSTATAAAAAPAATTPSRSRRPLALVECLESRLCPSVTVSVGSLDHGAEVLRIKGPDSGQHVIITENDAAHLTTVQVDANGDGLFTGPGDYNQTFNTLFERISIKLPQGSSNTVDYLLGSDMAGADRDFRLKMGHGTNFFNFDAQGHAVTADTLLTFSVFAGNNNASENVNFAFGAISNSEVDFGVKLGNGTHTVNAVFNGAISDHALVQSDITLGNGIHNVSVNLLGSVTTSTVSIDTLGGDDPNGHDIVKYFVGGAVSGNAKLDLSMELRNGDDTGQILVSQSGFSVLDDSRAYFTIDGGEGNDTINYGSDHTAGTIAVDGLVDALLIGAAGNDKINIDFPQTAALALAGTFRVEADGNDGRDAITGVLSNTADSTGSYDVLLFGGSGDDTFSLTNNDPTGTGILYDFYGLDIIDGGSGHDVATTIGDGIETHGIGG